jgi:hypothetical protein
LPSGRHHAAVTGRIHRNRQSFVPAQPGLVYCAGQPRPQLCRGPPVFVGSHILKLFKIDDQVFIRTGTETRATSNGRTVRLVVWASNCPDCGRPFTQAHRGCGFVPTKNTLRRCGKCRKGPGKRVAGSRNGGQKFSPSPVTPVVPVPARQSRRARAGTLRHALSSCPRNFPATWNGQQAAPRRAAHAPCVLGPRQPMTRRPGVFTDR